MRRGGWWLRYCAARSPVVQVVRRLRGRCALQPLWVMDRTSERGSGTVLALSIVTVLVMLLGVVHLISISAAAAAQSARSADLAALAGADVARGLGPGDPCTVAEEVVARNEGALESCAVGGESGTEVRVEVSVDALTRTRLRPNWLELPQLSAYGVSRAGPPEALDR